MIEARACLLQILGGEIDVAVKTSALRVRDVLPGQSERNERIGKLTAPTSSGTAMLLKHGSDELPPYFIRFPHRPHQIERLLGTPALPSDAIQPQKPASPNPAFSLQLDVTATSRERSAPRFLLHPSIRSRFFGRAYCNVR